MANSNTPENHPGDDRNFHNTDPNPKSAGPNGNPYDSENLDQESETESKDITEQDIEKHLIDNDPSEGFETDMDIQKSNEAESGPFETIEPKKDNPVNREFEIGQLGREQLKEDERTRDETSNGETRNNKPAFPAKILM
ncbi:hypothetical protein [Flavobacterium sp. LAR06]|uniref:hypothetical protein n=1 Tax=Flavobacterium sp. LAR06 TaxID=3064897 RepID=UPI0035C05077